MELKNSCCLAIPSQHNIIVQCTVHVFATKKADRFVLHQNTEDNSYHCSGYVYIFNCDTSLDKPTVLPTV